jgi:hypothetical protein
MTGRPGSPRRPQRGIMKPAPPALRRRAATLALAMSCASTRSMRPATAASQNRGNRRHSRAELSGIVLTVAVGDYCWRGVFNSWIWSVWMTAVQGRLLGPGGLEAAGASRQ